jgi:hypothetical protein
MDSDAAHASVRFCLGRQGGANAVAAAFMQEAIRPHVTGRFGEIKRRSEVVGIFPNEAASYA